jgi:protein-tyrosine phosphatase
VIDLHTHLLPGVDDGATSDDEALGVIARFADEGVRVIACTPHLRASRVATLAADALQERFEAFRTRVPAGVTLTRGWEILLDEPGVELARPHLLLGGSSAVLVEFPRGQVPVHSERELFRISMSGAVPVLAHPERYRGCTVALARAWRAAGAALQVDAAMLLGTSASARVAHALLAHGLVDLVASDNHGDSRSMALARDWLREHGADEQAELLTRANPERLLRNERPLPVPPFVLAAGPLGRLRSWLAARVGGAARGRVRV